MMKLKTSLMALPVTIKTDLDFPITCIFSGKNYIHHRPTRKEFGVVVERYRERERVGGIHEGGVNLPAI